MFDVKMIADKAEVIIDGYAIIKEEDQRTTVVNLNQGGHAVVILPSGEMDETNMDDIELVIAKKYLDRARKYMERKYA